MSRGTRQLSSVLLNQRVCRPVSLPIACNTSTKSVAHVTDPCHPLRKRTSGRLYQGEVEGKTHGCEVRSKAIDQTSHHVTVTQNFVIRMTPVNIPSGNLNRKKTKHQYAVQLQQNHRNYCGYSQKEVRTNRHCTPAAESKQRSVAATT